MLPNAKPVVVRVPEQSLAGGVALFGGQTRPAHRLAVVLHNTETVVVRRPEKSLPDGVSLLGENTGRFQVAGAFIAAGWHAGQQRDGNPQTDQ